jgi:flagellin-specific chaperone FliS
LLEPSNNNASTQNEMEELREVSQQLQEIKKKHDEAKKMANKKQDDLEKVKKEID